MKKNVKKFLIFGILVLFVISFVTSMTVSARFTTSLSAWRNGGGFPVATATINNSGSTTHRIISARAGSSTNATWWTEFAEATNASSVTSRAITANRPIATMRGQYRHRTTGAENWTNMPERSQSFCCWTGIH